MVPTFTGNSRRPRQVNLSGRNTNPFAKFGSPQGPQNAVANAQQDRLARQQERERLRAAKAIQVAWRATLAREALRRSRRDRWDTIEFGEGVKPDIDGRATIPYRPTTEALLQLQSLILIFKADEEDDFTRLRHFYSRLAATISSGDGLFVDGPWPVAYSQLEEICLKVLETRNSAHRSEYILEILSFLTEVNPSRIARRPSRYYGALSKIVKQAEVPLEVVVAPLRSSFQVSRKYEAFAFRFLTTPNLDTPFGLHMTLRSLCEHVQQQELYISIARVLRDANDVSKPNKTRSLPILNEYHNPSCRLWLLGYTIYFHHQAEQTSTTGEHVTDPNYMFVVSHLLSSVIDLVEFEPSTNNDVDDDDYAADSKSIVSISAFVRSQIESLVNQASLSALLAQMDLTTTDNRLGRQSDETGDHSRLLATYILSLFRMFPRRGDEIRMWLYLGLSTSPTIKAHNGGVPVLHYFWHATRSTQIFKDIIHNPRAAIEFLKQQSSTTTSNHSNSGINDEWRIILLFIELYVFVLKVMDDEEFFSAGKPAKSGQLDSLGRRNSLPLDDIKVLVTFLKHLGFSMYYDASEITASVDLATRWEGVNVFRPGNQNVLEDSVKLHDNNHIAGLQGMSLDYVKGTVTGLLRAIYERDSRRTFLPSGHWLMTSRFDMTNFIDTVVEEEERRHEVQEDGDGVMEHEPEPVELFGRSSGLVGTGYAQRIQRLEQMQRQQRAIAHRRHLQAVAPRLEILQNMPFLIPFETRVKIFRRFIDMDQIKRRGGAVDPELWRLLRGQREGPFRGGLERHGAKIRRGHEFEDAYEAFFSLGPALKEPISITFVDRFDNPEPGIDGGGVTKEFLTSVTNQAFAPSDDTNLFAENENHFLYPNPSAVEDRKELLRETGFTDDLPTFRDHVTSLLQRYEFLGRVIGKCLYEGILVDISFAGFFLLKWALTGGPGLGPRESGYRANLNDLRDFDESLYQGLVSFSTSSAC